MENKPENIFVLMTNEILKKAKKTEFKKMIKDSSKINKFNNLIKMVNSHIKKNNLEEFIENYNKEISEDYDLYLKSEKKLSELVESELKYNNIDKLKTKEFLDKMEEKVSIIIEYFSKIHEFNVFIDDPLNKEILSNKERKETLKFIKDSIDNNNWKPFEYILKNIFTSQKPIDAIKKIANKGAQSSKKPLSEIVSNSLLEQVKDVAEVCKIEKEYSKMYYIEKFAFALNSEWEILAKESYNKFYKIEIKSLSEEYNKENSKDAPVRHNIHQILTNILMKSRALPEFPQPDAKPSITEEQIKSEFFYISFDENKERKRFYAESELNLDNYYHPRNYQRNFNDFYQFDKNENQKPLEFFTYAPTSFLKYLRPLVVTILEEDVLDLFEYGDENNINHKIFKNIIKLFLKIPDEKKEETYDWDYCSDQEIKDIFLSILKGHSILIPNWFLWLFCQEKNFGYENSVSNLKLFDRFLKLQDSYNKRFLSNPSSLKFYNPNSLKKGLPTISLEDVKFKANKKLFMLKFQPLETKLQKLKEAIK